jgi:hypothetical protein
VPSRIHSILPRVAIVIGAIAVPLLILTYVAATRPYEVPDGKDIFSVAQGRWAWTTTSTGCAKDWHRISFNADRSVMTIASSKPYRGADGKWDSLAVYDILAHSRSFIRGAIRGETRMTPDHHPVVWDLVLRSPDRYAWHRTDWLFQAYTADIERCPESGTFLVPPAPKPVPGLRDVLK